MKLTQATTDFSNLFSAKYVFNPTIGKRADGQYILICRLQDHEREGALGFAILDSDFEVTGDVHVMAESPLGTRGVMLEDPRFIQLSDGDYISYIESSPTQMFTTYVVLAKLEGYSLLNAVVPDYKKNRSAHTRLVNAVPADSPQMLPSREWIIEKNWQFFTAGQKNYCIYYAEHEHNVFEFDILSGSPGQQFITFFRSAWKHGKISGGASPVLCADGLFYSFFHSWTADDNKKRTYHVGLYTFESKPPFRVLEVSSKPLISASDPGSESPSTHAVVFPAGAIYNPATDDWIIATGLNDHACGWLRIRHSEARSGLRKVHAVGKLNRSVLKACKKITRYCKKRLAALLRA